MSSCEKCWADSGGSHREYIRLVAVRRCTPEEQAGPAAGRCPMCNRTTLHQHTGECMACNAAARSTGGRTMTLEESLNKLRSAVLELTGVPSLEEIGPMITALEAATEAPEQDKESVIDTLRALQASTDTGSPIATRLQTLRLETLKLLGADVKLSPERLLEGLACVELRLRSDQTYPGNATATLNVVHLLSHLIKDDLQARAPAPQEPPAAAVQTRLRPTPFLAYKFLLRDHELVKLQLEAYQEPTRVPHLGVSAVYTDPFSGILWIGRAHFGQDIQTWLAVGEGTRAFQVWMLPRRQSEAARCLEVAAHPGPRHWHPLDLDAARDAVAMEWLGIGPGVAITLQPDVPAAEIPKDVADVLNPTGRPGSI